MNQVLTKESKPADPVIRFHAQGVTGTESVEVQFQRSTPAETVAKSLAEMLRMPDDTAYGLRDDESSAYLDDREIGEQIQPGSRLTLTPKTHLG